MNLYVIALLLLAWQLLGSKNASSNKTGTNKPDLLQLFSDDAKNMLDCMNKLSSQKSTADDKMGALFQIISNPAVMEMLQNIMPKKQPEEKTPRQDDAAKNEFTNEEGYRFETPSAESQQFFRPIDGIADAEIKSKLYWFYDNWYIK